jgi:hypothetical protein
MGGRLGLGAMGLTAVLLAAAACAHGGAATAPPPSCQPRSGGTSLAGAKQAAVSYVTDIAAHHYDAAGTATEPCNQHQYTAIRKLWKFMAGMPVGQSQVKAQARKGTTWPGSARVDVTVYIRFGTPPYSSWITAATRTLQLDSRPGGWRVTTDVTKKQKGKLSAYGFQSYNRPVFLSGNRATVVYSAASDERDARTILHTADSVVGQLWRTFGGGRAAQRPILFLVRNRKQAEKLAHIQLGITRTPAGFQYSSYTYVDLPQWESFDDADQRSMVVHELTHVASRAWLQKAPHSLVEGVAMYEENLWRVQHHLGRTALVDLRAFYRHGFPSMTIWERRETDWGLRNPYAVDACYMDGMTMVQQIVSHHGGIPALRRLGAAFSQRAGTRDFSAADVDSAFRQALGVSFAQVVAEAHATVGA